MGEGEEEGEKGRQGAEINGVAFFYFRVSKTVKVTSGNYGAAAQTAESNVKLDPPQNPPSPFFFFSSVIFQRKEKRSLLTYAGQSFDLKHCS